MKKLLQPNFSQKLSIIGATALSIMLGACGVSVEGLNPKGNIQEETPKVLTGKWQGKVNAEISSTLSDSCDLNFESRLEKANFEIVNYKVDCESGVSLDLTEEGALKFSLAASKDGYVLKTREQSNLGSLNATQSKLDLKLTIDGVTLVLKAGTVGEQLQIVDSSVTYKNSQLLRIQNQMVALVKAPVAGPNPPKDEAEKATSFSDAKFVACQGNKMQVRLAFPRAQLRQDSYGMIGGEVGEALIEWKAVGQNKWQSATVDYPSLFANGPSTKIIAYDYNANLNFQVTTWDFKTGTAVHVSEQGSDAEMTCAYYKTPTKK